MCYFVTQRISKDAVDDPPKEVVPKKSKKKKVLLRMLSDQCI